MGKWHSLLSKPNRHINFDVKVIDKNSPHFGRKGSIFFGFDDGRLVVTWGGVNNFDYFYENQLK
jgi:hypothetical protein